MRGGTKNSGRKFEFSNTLTDGYGVSVVLFITDNEGVAKGKIIMIFPIMYGQHVDDLDLTGKRIISVDLRSRDLGLTYLSQSDSAGCKTKRFCRRHKSHPAGWPKHMPGGTGKKKNMEPATKDLQEKGVQHGIATSYVGQPSSNRRHRAPVHH